MRFMVLGFDKVVFRGNQRSANRTLTDAREILHREVVQSENEKTSRTE